VKIISDQRGIKQEVKLITKRGIEAKSYEGVSSPYIIINVSVPYKTKNTYHTRGFSRETF